MLRIPLQHGHGFELFVEAIEFHQQFRQDLDMVKENYEQKKSG